MRIIDIIELVDMRNKNLLSDKPMGINIDKYFMPSVANTIGVDLKTYKLVPHNCFACNLMHVGRDERVPMAINKKEDPVLVSPAYLVFRVKESVDVLPDFLMLWFRRPTFDRNAWFFTAGDVRGGLDKKDFFNMEVHVPDIATQRRIVAESQAVEKRIATNNKLIETLTSTIQSIFFDSIVSKSSNENLPNGWSRAGLKDIASFMNGAACQKFPSEKGAKSLPVIKIKEIGRGMFDENSDRVSLDIPTKYLIHDGDTLFSWSASLIVDFWCGGTGALNQHIFKVTSDKYPQWFYHLWIQQHIDEWNNFISAKATSMGHIKQEDLESAAVIIPDDNTLCTLDKQLSPITDYLIAIKREYIRLQELRSLLLSRLSNI